MGQNVLVGSDPEQIEAEALRALRSRRKSVATPPLWDGKAAERIVCVLRSLADSHNRGRG
jgi:UDP-N-acetylglucosamine 2-epimerase (non-hydrolysing)